MTRRIHPAFIASLGAIAVMLAASETFARSGSSPRSAFASAHSTAHPSALRSHRHHRLNDGGLVWDSGYGFYGSTDTEFGTGVAQPAPGDVHVTYDVPWNWAHQYPPILTPTGRPYVPSCPTQTVTVPGHDGKRQAVNITQCF
jgi:hypothetical protein